MFMAGDVLTDVKQFNVTVNKMLFKTPGTPRLHLLY